MSQYSRLLCATRVPQHGIDKLTSHPGNSHVVIMRNGHFYSILAAASDGMCVGVGREGMAFQVVMVSQVLQ